MARKTNHAYFQKAAHNAYLKVKEQLGLTDDMPETLKVNILLDAGVEYMEMVSFMDDRLKDSHRQVKNIVKVGQGDWKDILSIAGKETVTTRARNAFERKTKNREETSALRQVFLNSYVDSQETVETSLPKEFTASLNIEETFTDPEFNNILENSVADAVDRRLANKTLNRYALAAVYCSDFKFCMNDYICMLKWKLNNPTDNGTRAPQLFNIIARFVEAYHMCQQYDLTAMNEYLADFGMEINLKSVKYDVNNENMSKFWKGNWYKLFSNVEDMPDDVKTEQTDELQKIA